MITAGGHGAGFEHTIFFYSGGCSDNDGGDQNDDNDGDDDG